MQIKVAATWGQQTWFCFSLSKGEEEEEEEEKEKNADLRLK
jgi:hypothetical protein